MAKTSSKTECTVVCWAIAAVVGVVAMVMLYAFGGFSAIQAIFTGGVLGTVLGVVLSLFICRDQRAAIDLASDEKPADRYARQAEADAAARRVSGPAATTNGSSAVPASSATAEPAAVPASAPKVSPSQPLAGQAELAARKGDWKYQGDTAKKSAKAAPSKAAPAPAKEASKAKRAPVAADGKPDLMDGPRPEGADDLKLISGVGPKLEQTLNELGIWHFNQVANWRKKEIAWVDERLRFKGRIERDDWMSQAKILAKGGETEFSKKKKK